MKNFILKPALFFLIFIIASCSLTRGSKTVVKGKYKISRTEISACETCTVILKVFDRNEKVPISLAQIKVQGDTSLLTKSDGTAMLNLPVGKYIFEIENFGNTSIKTKPVEIKPNSRTEIKFELGTIVIP